jgi:hypothetical protein
VALQDGACALYLASQNGHVGIVRMLTEAGANLELLDLVRPCPAGTGLCWLLHVSAEASAANLTWSEKLGGS